MSPDQLEIILIAALVTCACTLSGVFLVLRRIALLSDAISHSVLFGIVIMFLLVQDLNSPWLILAAALTGVLTALLVELLAGTRLVREDASIGLVFPVLFSIGVILISLYAGNVHLDTDAVLVGEIAFAPLDRSQLFGLDLPRSAITVGGVLLINLAFIGLFYKELKLATFDAGLAAALGFTPVLLHYSLVGLVSLTAVTAFDAVGSVLVVALMIAPPAAAYLLTDRLPLLIGLALLLGVLSAVGGYLLSVWLDTSIAGMIAVAAGAVFGLALVLAPQRGLLAQWRRQRRQRWQFAAQLLAVHLLQHEGDPDEEFESGLLHLGKHLRWPERFAGDVVAYAQKRGLVLLRGERLWLTDHGRSTANSVLGRS